MDYLAHDKLPDDQEVAQKIIQLTENFILIRIRKDKRLHRKIRENVIAPYMELHYHDDLIEIIH